MASPIRSATESWSGLHVAAAGLGSFTPDPSRASDARHLPPPKSLALIVTQEREAPHCANQIVEVLLWCADVGIQTIYLYDAQGIFEDMLTEIQDKCWLRDSSATTGKDIPETAHRFVFAVADRVPAVPNREPYQVQVQVLSARHVVDTLQAELLLPSPNAIPQSYKAKSPSRLPHLTNAENEIVVPKIAQALTRPCEDNPLEVAFVFGPHATLGGFPPWMTHLCEIFHMGILNEVSRSALDNSMNKYRNITQRFGR
eukprot:CAMPEP_0198208264 /NCGR_PEP_ID=MMETSP1445-20131203/11649_1 /TAXON_ID=36898 /ORGANISM="Pyramimonas sp., Strain CCMP2087" /LENGTH=256 /DNA_ID=CAMNT_0043881595 /DNA_START=404 /DNA_END=1175 /DNA_ORIENTATION=-